MRQLPKRPKSLLNKTITARYTAANGYIEVWFDDGTRAYEHRVVATAMLGRDLSADETVHHRNEIKSDNRPENLEVLARGAHSSLHKAVGRTMRSLTCPCGKVFERDVRQVAAKKKAGQTHFYCSRQCHWDALRSLPL